MSFHQCKAKRNAVESLTTHSHVCLLLAYCKRQAHIQNMFTIKVTFSNLLIPPAASFASCSGHTCVFRCQ